MESFDRLKRAIILIIPIFAFFFMLGSRSLNEPDEGRYAEIAREMLETGNWLVPHFWYMPHLDKPPFTYWAVALSMKLFGQNEWAVRLPTALAGLLGILGVFCFGSHLGGRKAGVWSALILQSSLLFFAMSRMLTTDIFLTTFIVWTMYCGWRAWRALDEHSSQEKIGWTKAKQRSFSWHLAMWLFMGLGFLVKGPIACIIPIVSFLIFSVIVKKNWFLSLNACPTNENPTLESVLTYNVSSKIRFMAFSSLAGIVLFSFIAFPWYVTVWKKVPDAFQYMVTGQFFGHALGTTIKNRGGPIVYFIPILLLGTLPWTPLLGWIWKCTLKNTSAKFREGMILLNSWILFTFILFSLSSSKLPAYILPLFPGLAVLISALWFSEEFKAGPILSPKIWRAISCLPSIEFAVILVAIYLVFKAPIAMWFMGISVCWIVISTMLAKKIHYSLSPESTLCQSLLLTVMLSWLTPQYETYFKGNQTLKPLAEALKAEYLPGDEIVIIGNLPQGFPFYAYPVINATNRPYLSGYSPHHVPFEFPGNIDRMRDHLLRNDTDLLGLLQSAKKTWVIGFNGSFNLLAGKLPTNELAFVSQVGRWELFSNDILHNQNHLTKHEKGKFSNVPHVY